jgi:hypothetical protein
LGDINIGTGNTSAAPNINIGAVTGSIRAGAIISIGKLTTNAITIGHSTANVTISSSSGSIKTPALTTGTFTASSSITANGGITIPAGKKLTANGGITSDALDASTTNGAQTIGSNIIDGSITIGGSMTTGDINIGTISTSDIYIGNSTNATTGVNKGTCHISKCQFGDNGSYFREMRFGAVGLTASTGTVTFSPAMIATPVVTATIVSVQTNQVISILITAVSTTGFSYVKTYIATGGSLGPSGEAFNWIAISV